MKSLIKKNKEECGKEAALLCMRIINETISKKGFVNVIFATGAAQFEMLKNLVTMPVDWKALNGFHLDEYIGLSIHHKASFRKFLKERLVEKVSPGEFHYINGEADPQQECLRLKELILKYPIDLAFVGIGENTHLAFNDPPADFETEEPYIQVVLDEACRRQQLNEGWFTGFDQVPEKAISMSIKHIMKSENIIAVVPEQRKARAIQLTLQSEINPLIPASILRTHSEATLFLDEASASLIKSPR
jgi:glucosamine-6-phosphate deaminase